MTIHEINNMSLVEGRILRWPPKLQAPAAHLRIASYSTRYQLRCYCEEILHMYLTDLQMEIIHRRPSNLSLEIRQRSQIGSLRELMTFCRDTHEDTLRHTDFSIV